MHLISLYILRQLIGPFVLIMISLIGIVWLAQSLRFVELIVLKGLTFESFINLTILIIPKLTAAIIPFVAYLATTITFLKLSSESEIIAMRSAGISNFRIILAPIIFGCVLVILSFILDSHTAPTALNKFKNLQSDIRDRYISTLFQEKVFSSPTSGLTVFVREIDKFGTLKGILIHDSREPKKTYTIMADSAKIEKRTTFAVESHTTYDKELKVGDEVDLNLLFLDRDKKRLVYKLQRDRTSLQRMEIDRK